MQQLLANYLFLYKNCPLPQIGTLHLQTVTATSEIGTQKINPPVNNISFTKEEIESKNLAAFIAANKNISVNEAEYQLKNISQEINSLKEGQEFSFAGIGTFSKSQNDHLVFNQVQTDLSFAQPVYAERVIHPDDSHAILVGDKETDRNTMTEFFTETESVKKSKWWMWAAALFVISAIMIIIYFNDKNHNGFFGISNKYQLKETTNQYKNIP